MRMPHPLLVTVASIIVCLLALVAVYALRIASYGLMLRAPITSDVWVVQRPFRMTYDLVSTNGTTLVPAVDGWIVRGGYLFGSHGDRGYFAIALPAAGPRLFEDMAHLNRYLADHGLPMYDISDEESAVDIKYSRGRQRRYLPE